MASSEESHAELKIDCSDVAMFQESLRELRKLDDRIQHALNTSIPTQSFAGKENPAEKCKALHIQMKEGNKYRESVIKKCIGETAGLVDRLRQQYAQDNDFKVQQQLKKQQFNLRMTRQELGVEEIIRDRSEKIFHERCRQHYNPDL